MRKHLARSPRPVVMIQGQQHQILRINGNGILYLVIFLDKQEEVAGDAAHSPDYNNSELMRIVAGNGITGRQHGPCEGC